MRYSSYSAVIVGSGVAGLYSALSLSKNSKVTDNILLVTKGDLSESNSYFAQGGIVGVMRENAADTITSHIEDTINAGGGLNIQDSVKNISENSDFVINDLINHGVDFDRDENGKLSFTLEAAHSVRRVLHSGGDATGRHIQTTLANAVKELNNVDIYEDTTAVELLISENNECKGIVLFNNLTCDYEIVYSPVVVLATGGIGQIYKYTTNPLCATGDGLALAYNAGLKLRDTEFVQFHPTALAVKDLENRPLLTEALRGEGAVLLNNDGERFMPKYDKRGELAPRDVVTRAIATEMRKNGADNVYLDATLIDYDKLITRFPTVRKICKNAGIDITKEPIPTAPAAHYFMGGIVADTDGKTSVKGLFAVGETASTGLHGANRLASNSLLECAVCAYNMVKTLGDYDFTPPKQIDSHTKLLIDRYGDDTPVNGVEADTNGLLTALKNTMWNNAGIFRDEKSLKTALNDVSELVLKFNREYKCYNKEEYELRNMLITARAILICALNRRESRGAHYRTDYPQMSERPQHSIYSKEKNYVE
ncbi:L-aspartate oxidase [bacterium]|nr:L-aspartate oxidase [bacterium]